MKKNYLNEYLEQEGHGACFDNLVFIASEIINDSTNDTIEEFFGERNESICETLSWRQGPDVIEMIEQAINESEDEHGTAALARLLYQNNMQGFLARCLIPVHEVRFDDTGEQIGSRFSYGHCRVFWVYGHDITELVFKTVEKAQSVYQEFVEEAKEKQTTV